MSKFPTSTHRVSRHDASLIRFLPSDARISRGSQANTCKLTRTGVHQRRIDPHTKTQKKIVTDRSLTSRPVALTSAKYCTKICSVYWRDPKMSEKHKLIENLLCKSIIKFIFKIAASMVTLEFKYLVTKSKNSTSSIPVLSLKTPQIKFTSL
jgi:hypothetical protein